MKQMLNFTPNMTRPFLRYTENAHIGNQKVLRLIDELRQGLSDEDMIQSPEQKNRLLAQKQKNVMTCYCIMLYVECLANFSANNNPYDRFINNWINVSSANSEER